MIKLGRALPMEIVKDAKTPTRCWCLRCWKVITPCLDNIRNGGQGACEACGGTARLTDEEARHRAWEWGYIPDPDIPYTNDATKWPGKCRAMGHPCEPVLNSYKRSGPCGSCAKHGFKPHRPALLYLIVHPKLNAAKIGICEDSPTNTRLREHKANGWDLPLPGRIMKFTLGRDARILEDKVIRSWRARNLRVVLRNGSGYDGYLETVSLVQISAAQIWTEVAALAADLE